MDDKTPTVDAYELRRKYGISYQPFRLAKVRGCSTMHEFTCWPYEKNGRPLIMARVVEDPTTAREFEVRKEISPVAWGIMRQREYRAGWLAGQAYMRHVQEELRKQRETL